MIYVVSDVHLGNGSSKDHMVRGNRERLLFDFLDAVERSQGRLVILGDLLDLWRFRLDDVLGRWEGLLDRFASLSPDYVLGNHDAKLREDPVCRDWHPLFKWLRSPFTERIGDRRFCFMHGHEVDPFIPACLDRWGYLLGELSTTLRFRPSLSLGVEDAVYDIMLEWGEALLHLWHRMHRSFVNQIQHELFHWPDQGWRRLKAPLRTQNMLSRFYRHRSEGLYDVAVAGHTHVAGHFHNWYLNSGCWTQSVASFLKITPEGEARVFNWRSEGERSNHACVWRRCFLGS